MLFPVHFWNDWALYALFVDMVSDQVVLHFRLYSLIFKVSVIKGAKLCRNSILNNILKYKKYSVFSQAMFNMMTLQQIPTYVLHSLTVFLCSGCWRLECLCLWGGGQSCVHVTGHLYGCLKFMSHVFINHVPLAYWGRVSYWTQR